MTQEQYKEIKDLKDSIDEVRLKIIDIDKLLSSSLVIMNIKGGDVTYTTSDSKFIKDILTIEHSRYTEELNFLTDKFASL